MDRRKKLLQGAECTTGQAIPWDDRCTEDDSNVKGKLTFLYRILQAILVIQGEKVPYNANGCITKLASASIVFHSLLF